MKIKRVGTAKIWVIYPLKSQNLEKFIPTHYLRRETSWALLQAKLMDCLGELHRLKHIKTNVVNFSVVS